MKKGWEIKRLDQICTIKGRIGYRGYTKQDLVEKGKGAISLSPSNIKNNQIIYDDCTYISWFKYDESPEIKIYNGDIIYCKTASIGKIALIEDLPEKATINPQFVVLKEPKCLNKYLFFFMNSRAFKEQERSIISGTAIPTLSQTNLGNLLIPIPPLHEQQHIVTILDEVFSAIAKAKANTEKNLQNAKELFETYMYTLFANPTKEWKKRSLKEVCEISSKLVDPKKPEFQNLIHIGAGNIESKTGALIDLKTAKEEKLISGKFLFDSTMVLYSKIRPYLMKVVRCDFNGLCSADVYPLVPFKNELDRDFLYYLLLTKQFTDFATLGSQRAGMPKINREHLFAYSPYIPPVDLQKIIVEKLDSLSTQTKKLESMYQKKLADLEELRKSILQKAFDGELTAFKKELA